MNLDNQIDQLYQLPLNEFTPARNALVKQLRGADATRIREMQKPTVPAWAVNQLYWQNRPVYDEVVQAAERLRTAHRSRLAGKSVDLHKAEGTHRDAIRRATKEIRGILSASGESASQANLDAIGETLEALPAADEAPGRLTRPLKRMGFEALAGVASRPAGAKPARRLSLVSRRETKPPEPEIAPARKREIDEIEMRLRTAQTEERQLQVEIDRGRREVDRAVREKERAEQELADAAEKVKRLTTELAAKEKAQKAVIVEQKKLEERLEKLRP